MTNTANDTLAIDAGQTGIRVMHVDSSGATFREFAGVRTDRELLPQLVDVVGRFCIDTSLPVTTVAAGVSGLTEKESQPQKVLAGLTHLGVQGVSLAHDSITGFLGSLGNSCGAVVAAGTGVVTLGVGPLGIARVDGWGHIVGDAGSGYWIGRAALEAALRAHDGRGQPTSLTSIVMQNFSSPEAAYIELQKNPDRVRLVASFAKQVSELADSDSVAEKIIHDAGEELALSVATAMRRAGTPAGEVPHVSWAGSLLSGARLHAEFEAALRRRLSGVIITAPMGSPIDGVALLLSLEPSSPLHSAVFAARTKAS
jgi:glucosamine kinase